MARIHLSIRINKILRSGGHGRYLEKFRLRFANDSIDKLYGLSMMIESRGSFLCCSRLQQPI